MKFAREYRSTIPGGNLHVRIDLVGNWHVELKSKEWHPTQISDVPIWTNSPVWENLAETLGIDPADWVQIRQDIQSSESKKTSKEADIEDFCIEFEDKDGTPKFKFSPTKAERSIPDKHFELRMTAIDPDTIYWFDGQIYKPDGDRKIDKLICDTVGDRADGKNVNEVLRRIRNALLEEPVEFDPDPYLLGLRNGVADLRTGTVRPYRPEDLITDQIDVEYNPDARCPVFLKFLGDIAPNVTDRLTLVDWFVATAIKRPLPYVLFMLGLGRNGKGTYEDLLMRFFKEESFRGMSINEINKNSFAPGFFYKMRGWIASEQSGKKRATIGTDFMKLVSGSGLIDSDRKNKSRIQYRPFFQTLVDTNAMPPIEDTSKGWMERFIKIDLPYTFVPEPDRDDPLQKKKDPHLLDKLTTDEELSGILNLMLARSPEIVATGTITKRPAKEMFMEYGVQSSSVITFCELFCEYMPDALSVRIPTTTIYESYKKWCEYVVGEVVNEAYFGRYLKRFCDGRASVRPKIEGKNVSVYPGLLFYDDKVSECIEAIVAGFSGIRKQSQVDLKQIYTTNDRSTTISQASQVMWDNLVHKAGNSLYREETHQNACFTREHEKTTTDDPTIPAQEENVPESTCANDNQRHCGENDLPENEEVEVPAKLSQYLSELARKGQAAQVADLMRMGHEELEVLEALDEAGWTEIGRGWWEPPRREV